MWKFAAPWLALTSKEGVARRPKLITPIAVESLELRQLLSATSGIDRGSAAEAVVVEGRAVPKIDGVAGEYTLSGEPGTLTITQDGLNIHGVLSAEANPSGEFDAAFKKPQSKVAKGTGSFQFDGDEFSTPVKFKIKFRPDGEGGFQFFYRYREIKAT